MVGYFSDSYENVAKLVESICTNRGEKSLIEEVKEDLSEYALGPAAITWGCLNDKPDERDHLFSTKAEEVSGKTEGSAKVQYLDLETKIPDKIDWRKFASKPENQYHLGSCTANAVIGAYELLWKRRKKGSYQDLSKLFAYYNARSQENKRADNGATIRDALKAASYFGVCLESTVPYDTSKWWMEPPKAAYDEAMSHKVTRYIRCNSPKEVKISLAQGFPVVAGFKIFESFNQARDIGFVPVPNPYTEASLGGHAMCLVGYDMSLSGIWKGKPFFIVRNSWGVEWGDHGYCFIPFAYFDLGLVFDMWSLRTHMDF